MNYTTTWTFTATDNVTEPVRRAQEQIERATERTRRFGDCLRAVRAIDWQAASQGLNSFLGIFSSAAQVGEDYERALLDVSAITGVTGEDLDRLGGKARSLAKEFGGSATDNLGTFQTILSRLGPQIGNSEQAMERMGKYANTLAKTMGGDVVGATDALTTSMLQFKVDLDDPIAAASEMERMMNVMAAGAKEGAAEVPQIAQALVQAGGAAKLSNVSFEETNAALQSLAQSGKYGAEAGVGLRNVLIKMNAPSALSKEATTMLAQYGVNMQKVSDTTVPFAERLKELQKIGQNTDALAAVFGAENIQAAQGLINTADAQAELTQQITGTNVAVEQANTVMSGWGEKMSRVKAWFQDLQIAGFDVFKVLGAVGSGLGSTISVVGDLGAAYSGLGPVMKSFGAWISKTTLAKKTMALWTKIVTAKQWLWNAALSANPIGIIIVAIGALVAGIVWLASKITGWGEAWKHTWEGAKLLFEAWVSAVKANWNALINGLMIGLNKIQEGWYKFKNATGLGDEDENNKMLAQIQADTEARKKAIVDGYKEAGEKALQAKDEFVKAAGSLSWKKDEEKTAEDDKKSSILSPNAAIGGVTDESWKNLNNKGKGGKGDKEKTMNVGGSGSGSKTINIKIEQKNYFTIDRSVGSKDAAANGVITKLNDRMRDALATI
ncbi:phage tail tape measure protein [Capnocytophaga sp.]|uniref:phage tail tape measure protein n=1 Tax=Capnocytophaga sp. TaxID=44737 RepID=UPI0026DB7312|nr:phage tail tape measure protein [Capnocytophaga sp.]MDO5106218.1 phage tail tape measure protein [Capnocytophaga sp.]